MLIRFSLENWMSFRDPVTFSMVASRERQHRERVPCLERYHARILPVAAIYGGNASGKTNFFRALNFARTLVVHGVQPDARLSVDRFCLDADSLERPTRFVFELLVDEAIYEFSFSLTPREVLEEKLVLVMPRQERTLYHRQGKTITFDSALLKEEEFLKLAPKGMRDNQLFLTSSILLNLAPFRPVYDWFKDRLELVAPDSRFGPFEQFLDESHPLYSTMNRMLRLLDTGIAHLGGEDIPFDRVPIPERVREDIESMIKEGETLRLLANENERIVFARRNGEILAKKLVSYHQRADGTEVRFDLKQESDGSQRVIDLLPAFLELSRPGSTKVFVIDELDRSLHTLLTRRLLEGYLSSCSTRTRAQLLMTTHDVLLMDQRLLRRDEMWVAERQPGGESMLTSFAEYRDVRYDKDLRRSYLQGRLGGIPRLLLDGNFTESLGQATPQDVP